MVKQDLTDDKILRIIRQEPELTENEIALKLGIGKNEVINRIRRLSDTRIKIMVVDDERDLVDTLRLSLESDGYNVIGAYSGNEAIEKAHAEIPDLILLDIVLPDMDGYEICGRLREDPLTRLVPIIMLTGKGGLIDKIEGLEKGADDYITKPFNLHELRARIRTVLRRSMT
ncbi:MAG: response regulator [Candidatus Methanoperedens sp.]|nr:response regulator [Candidatus Methanoperedens sp.]